MRIAVIAGLPGSGKTTVGKAACAGRKVTYIANNPRSEDAVRDVVTVADHYPYKSPCARVRQFSYRIELHASDDVPIIVSEPPGNCLEQSSPMLNPIYAADRSCDIAPLITVLDGRIPANGAISKRNTDGLRVYRMVEESDVLALTFSDHLSQSDRALAVDNLREINEDCEIVFCSPSDGYARISELIFGDAKYSRPLYY